MTQDEFIEAYCERSGVPWDSLRLVQCAIPCDCGAVDCDGWQMIASPEIEPAAMAAGA